MEIPEDLSCLKRRELQTLCKAHDIKANMKNVDMIKALQQVMSMDSTTSDTIQSDKYTPIKTAPSDNPNSNRDQQHIEANSRGSPGSHGNSDAESTRESDITNGEVFMDVSIKVNVGSPPLSREVCLGDEEEMVNNELEESKECLKETSVLSDISIVGGERSDIGLGEEHLGPESITEDNTVSSQANRKEEKKDCKLHVEETTKLKPEESQQDVLMESNESPYSSGSPPPVIINNYRVNESTAPGTPHFETTPTLDEDVPGEKEMLNTTFTINSPEGDMSEGPAALNDSLTAVPSSRQMDVTPLRGCWLARNTATSAKDSPLTLNHTFVKSTDTHTLTTGDSPVNSMAAAVEEREEQEQDNGEYTEDKENVKIKMMALLDSKVNAIMNDPNYVSDIKSSGAPASRIPVKKGSITAKFNKLHKKEFDKMKSIDSYQNRKRRLDDDRGDGITLHANKKPKTDASQDKAITGKKSTIISKDAIARLSTPKHVKKKTFTKATNSSLRTPFKP